MAWRLGVVMAQLQSALLVRKELNLIMVMHHLAASYNY